MMFSRTWIVFAILSCIALAALGWTGKTVLELEHAQEKAQRDAVLEESIRLALGASTRNFSRWSMTRTADRTFSIDHTTLPIAR